MDFAIDIRSIDSAKAVASVGNWNPGPKGRGNCGYNYFPVFNSSDDYAFANAGVGVDWTQADAQCR